MNIENLVFSGGSIKAISYIGCIQALEEYDIRKNIKTIAGTSAGGFFASIMTLGYTAKEMKSIVLGIDFGMFKDITTESILAFMNNYGFDTGNKLMQFIRILIKKKCNNENITFQELYDLTNIQLILTGTCLNTKEVEYFSYKTHPEMKLIDAIRITVSIPLIYNKVQYEEKMYIDGAVLDNYPIQLFNQYKDKTIGFLLSSANDCNVSNIGNYIKSIISCINHKLRSYQIMGFDKQTVNIEVDLSTLEFSISREKKDKIITMAYDITKEYLINRIESEQKQQEQTTDKIENEYTQNDLETEIELLLQDLELENDNNDQHLIIQNVIDNLIKTIEQEQEQDNFIKNDLSTKIDKTKRYYNYITVNEDGKKINIKCPL